MKVFIQTDLEDFINADADVIIVENLIDVQIFESMKGINNQNCKGEKYFKEDNVLHLFRSEVSKKFSLVLRGFQNIFFRNGGKIY